MDKANRIGQSFGGILSARQLLFDADPEGKKREEESMRDFLNSREVLPQSESPFVGSNEILAGVFDVINRQVFNANFDGIQLEWCDRLKSRACISYEQITYSTKQTYLRCSKAWFKNRNRQHFVEAILYELIQLYVQKCGSVAEEDISSDLLAYLIDRGTKYFNSRFETKLIVNNNYKPRDDDTDVQEILASIVVERKPSTGKITNFTFTPKVELLTKMITGNWKAVQCEDAHGCGSFCYGNGCPAAIALRKRYLGSNIYFIFTVDRLQCFLCEGNIKKGTLNAHFNKHCKAFGRPKENFGHA